MGGEQSAFRSLVPSASTAAIAFLTRLREHQIQQQVEMEKEVEYQLLKANEEERDIRISKENIDCASEANEV